MRKRGAAVLALVAGLSLALSGCVSGGLLPDPEPGQDREGVLRIIAGSEVKDLEPLLAEAKSKIGVEVELKYIGTLEGTELVANGGADGIHDATWFPNNRYFSLLPGAASKTSTTVRIMNSPVVLGLRPEVASRLGWDKTAPTWAELAQAAAEGKFSYGMTNPAASNSGFSALVAVATALSGTGTSLTSADINPVIPQMKDFFSGQKLTAGSSGWLADKVAENPQLVDGMINYESVLMGETGQGYSVIIPTDGVMISDYPLTLLSSASEEKRALFDKLTQWLTSPEIQNRIVQETHRRPGVPGIDTGSMFPSGVLFETPFPNTLDVVNLLISSYLDSARPPAQTLFVLDTSGSMSGDRIDKLRASLKSLAGAESGANGSFTEFRNRERVTLISFAGSVDDPYTVEVPESNKQAALEDIQDYADELRASGGTAMYQGLLKAYQLAQTQLQERPDSFVSVVLMTDGISNDYLDYDDFEKYFRALPSEVKSAIPTFVILFGESNVEELTQIASLTDGRVFDALSGDLSGAFKEIRGYQ